MLAAQGTPSVDAQHQALGTIGRMIEQQASLLAYIDVFFSYAVFAALMIAIAFLLRRVEHPHAASVMH